MRRFQKVSIVVSVACLVGVIGSITTVRAATTPSLGAAATYGVLGGTYTNTVAGTTIHGDAGWTTGPAVVPAGGPFTGAGGLTATARTDASAALTNLNSQACTFTFAAGAINLATDTTHGTAGIYTPGVYCTTGAGAASIGTAGITLSGEGTYIFRVNGALTSADNSTVTLAGGASASDVFWTPIAATTLGANTTFKGTIIDNANAITVGAGTAWIGRALSLGAGTVTTDTDTITVPITLRVIKSVINDNGGTASSSAWTLTVSSSNGGTGTGSAVGVSSPGTAYTLQAGKAYSVAESGGPTGYSSSASGDCTIASAVAGTTYTCTITNDDIAPDLHLRKVVINDNGGTALNTAWTLTATGTGGSPTNLTGTTPVDSGATFKADTYTLSESGGPVGYTASAWVCVGGAQVGSAVTVALGESVTCTITNNDIAPQLTVTKTVVNDNGGTKVISQFPLFIDGGSVTSGVANTTTAGLHTVSETIDSGYTSVIGGDCAANGTITLALGDVKTCTITNNDIAPALHLRKTVINDNGGTALNTAWTLTATGTGGSPTNLTGTTPVDSGATFKADTYTLSESGGPVGYTASAWVCVGGAQVGSAVTVALGESVTCTITNNDVVPGVATLNVIKHIVNDNGGTASAGAWTLTVSSSNGGTGTGSAVGTEAPGTAYTLQTGKAYSVAESGGPSGYSRSSSSDCTIASAVASTAYTCTITNNDIAPQLTVTKTVVNDNGGTKVISQFPLFIDGGSVTSGVANTTTAGLHTVSETIDSGYTSVIGGDCAANGTITLALGDVKTCTITNNDIAAAPATLHVVKTVVNDNGGTAVASDFTLNVTGTNVSPSSFAGSVAGVDVTLDAGSYAVTEPVVPTGYLQTGSGDCSGTITAGETKTCTITNDDIAPQLIVNKVVINDNGGTKVIANFSLFLDASSVTTGVANTTTAGLHTVSETADAGYATIIGGDCAANGTITLALGDVKTCTVTNNDIAPGPGTLRVVKTVINDNGGTAVASSFNLHVKLAGVEVAGSPAVGVVSPGRSYSLTAGTYVVSEDLNAAYTQSFGGACNAGGSVTLLAGSDVTCTITNDDIAPQLIVNKIVINDNGGTKVIANFSLFLDGGSVLSGIATTTTVGAHTVSETADSGYTSVIGGNCAANGTITLALGDVKICTITNDDNAPSGGGGTYYPPALPLPPLIDLVKVPNPLALPAGPGPVIYTYTLRNIGTVPVSDVTMVGDSCSPITLISGDTDGDSRLNVTEKWVYTCSTTLTQTHTNIVTAIGWANGISATDIANSTVIVGVPVVPPLIHVTKVPNPLVFSAGGGTVTYTDKVTNPGTVALSNVRLTDDKCTVKFDSGDTNRDAKLDPDETWTFFCASNLTKTTVNTVTASGEANGLTARDFAIATVVVADPAVIAAIVPKLPNTGVGSDEKSASRDIAVMAGVFVVLASLLFFARRNPRFGLKR